MKIEIDPEVSQSEITKALQNAGLFFDGRVWKKVPAWLKRRPVIVVPQIAEKRRVVK